MLVNSVVEPVKIIVFAVRWQHYFGEFRKVFDNNFVVDKFYHITMLVASENRMKSLDEIKFGILTFVACG